MASWRMVKRLWGYVHDIYVEGLGLDRAGQSGDINQLAIETILLRHLACTVQ